jgi:succinate dehydrogenase / fumarate reductase flavoprotein subunit
LIAVFKELRRGIKVYLDYSRNPEGLDSHALDERIKEWYIEIKGINLTQEEIKKNPLARLAKINLPSINWLKEHGIDLEKGERVEVAPAVQHFQGGIKIRRKGETTLKGLYACGECAGGEHGANRPGGNALLDSQVFGKISGRNAAVEAAGLPSPAIPEKRIESYLKRMTSVFNNKREGMPASLVRKKVQRILSGYAGVMRIGEELSKGIDKLKEIKKKECRIDENGLIYYLETVNIIDVAVIILNACRIRNESRGPHLRFNTFRETEPLPRDDDNWRKYIVIKKDISSHELKFEIIEPVRPCKATTDFSD